VQLFSSPTSCEDDAPSILRQGRRVDILGFCYRGSASGELRRARQKTNSGNVTKYTIGVLAASLIVHALRRLDGECENGGTMYKKIRGMPEQSRKEWSDNGKN
jgi:hypothetical protein